MNHHARKLLDIIDKKKTRLIWSADLPSTEQILEGANKLGPYICAIKIHCDAIDNFNQDFTKALKLMSQEMDFMIIEDRKFADIGTIANRQLHKGLYKLSSWVDFVTVHTIVGEGTIEGLKCKSVGLLLIGQLSSKSNLIDENYTNKTVELAIKHKDFVAGFISQEKISDDNFIYLTPGINLRSKSDNLGQKYKSPQEAYDDGSTCIIVGRGITNSSDMIKTAQTYIN